MKSWSADLFVTGEMRYSAELKVGVAQKVLLTDLDIVRHYADAGISHRAELAWVVMVPKAPVVKASLEKRYRKADAALRAAAGDRFNFYSIAIRPWLRLTVAVVRHVAGS